MIQIIKKQECIGCYACYNICPQNCISMQSDDEGFWYPVVDQTICNNCGLCKRVCPMTVELPIGNTPKAYAAWHKDEEIRQKSSSGGVFSALCEYVLQRSGAVFGATFNVDFTLSHSMAEKIEDYQRFRGSKYLQSKIGNTYTEVQKQLNNGRLILFSGTPCQVAGLQSFLNKNYDNLITCDLVCHGVPSPKVFQMYRLWLEQYYGAPARSVTFRDKHFGWKAYHVSFQFENGTEYHKASINDLFMQGFLKNVYLRPSCHHCHFSRIPRLADISLGDFWGVSAQHSEWDDDKGTSLVLVNTETGERVINACKTQLILHEASLDKAIVSNPCITGSAPPSHHRRAFFNDLDHIQFEMLIKKYCLDNLATKCKEQVMACFFRNGSKVKQMLKRLIIK